MEGLTKNELSVVRRMIEETQSNSATSSAGPSGLQDNEENTMAPLASTETDLNLAYEFPEAELNLDMYFDMYLDMYHNDHAMTDANLPIENPLGSVQYCTNKSYDTLGRGGLAPPSDSQIIDAPQAATLSPPSHVSLTLPAMHNNRTILTLENLDPEVRAEILDILCKRKVVTRIEIE